MACRRVPDSGLHPLKLESGIAQKPGFHAGRHPQHLHRFQRANKPKLRAVGKCQVAGDGRPIQFGGGEVHQDIARPQRAHGFECKTQGTLFFDVARILAVKRPAAFLLENVKNLKSHDKGRTFKVITETLEELGYWVADMVHEVGKDPRIIDGQHFVPQHRERIVLVGFRKDLNVHEGFTLRDIAKHYPKVKPKLADILDETVDENYILTQKLWEYLFNYSIKHKTKGNGFGYGLVTGDSVTRTLSARYYKDGSEILIDRGFDPKKPIDSPKNKKNRPRRLTPRECAKLMGYDKPGRMTSRFPFRTHRPISSLAIP